jgi:hypothetical protein
MHMSAYAALALLTAPANPQVIIYVRHDLRFLLPAAVRKTSDLGRSYSYLLAKPLAAVKWLLKTAEAV